MAEGLSRRKKIRGGHRSSATRTISESYETIESTTERELVITKLMQCKLTLEEKLNTIKRYDDEILELVEDEEVEDEIDQADTFNERVHRAMIDVTSAIETKRAAHSIATSPPAVESHVAVATSTAVTSATFEASVIPVTTVAASIPSTEAADIPVTSATVTSAPSGITMGSTTTASTSIVELHATPSVVFSTPLLLSSGARTTLTPSSIPLGELPSPSTGVADHPLHTAAIRHAPKVKLPKLTLKKFNGDLTKWTTFWDSYESSIHHNSQLSDIDKFIYLNSLLEGPASESISGLRLTAANYNEAVSILRRRFGNTQQIVSKHMEALLNLEAVTSQYNLKALRHLHDIVESQVRGLRALGVAAESYGSLLSPVILSKLPPEFRLIASREVKDDRWQLDELMRVIDTEVRARERACNGSNGGSRPIRGPTRNPPTSTTLLSSDSPIPKCSYCRQQHSSNSCQTVTDPSERKQILRRTGRCFVCLRKHHTSRECCSTLKCTHCNGRHHVSICTAASTQGPPSTTAGNARGEDHQRRIVW